MTRMHSRRILAALSASALVIGAGAIASAAIAPDQGPTSGGTVVSGDAPEGVVFTALASGNNHSMAIDSTGAAFGWGLGGGIGDGTNERADRPVRTLLPEGVTLSQIVAGNGHSIGLAPDGQAYGWGQDFYGQVGGGTGGTMNSRVLEPMPVLMPAGVSFTTIASSGSHTLALDAAGNAYGWGLNDKGQVGTGDTANVLAPVSVVLPDGVTFTAVAAGNEHSLAVGSDGRVYAWGANTQGSLGTGGTTTAPVPTTSLVPVPVGLPDGLTYTAVAAGNGTSLALRADGTADAWGANATGQLGAGISDVRSPVPVPVTMPAGVTFVELETGNGHALARDAAGVVYGWGANYQGQVGNGSTADVPTPTPVTMPAGVTFSSISTGSAHSLAVGSNGIGYTWGATTFGVLGQGDLNNDTTVPGPVDMGVRVTDVSFGGVAATDLTSAAGWTATTPAHACGIVDVEVTATQLGRTLTSVAPQSFTFGTAPAVVSHPAEPGEFSSGGQVVLRAAATGDDEPTVQWQQRDPSQDGWQDVAGAVEPELTFTVEETTELRAVFSNCLGEAVTDPVTATVVRTTPPVVDPETPPVGESPGPDGDAGPAADADELAVTGSSVALPILVTAGITVLLGATLRRVAQARQS